VDRNVQILKTLVVLVEIPFKSVHLRHGGGAGRTNLEGKFEKAYFGISVWSELAQAYVKCEY
jgi:hypothetical protein